MRAIWDLQLISGPHGVLDLFEVGPIWLLKAMREDFLLERRFLTGTDGVVEFCCTWCERLILLISSTEDTEEQAW